MSNILVIDDDPDMLVSLKDALASSGHVVQCAASGFQAIELAQNQGPDLIISDVRMAGMDGIECLERLRQICPDSRSIVVTGYAAGDTPVRAMLVECSDYLLKPFSSDQLTSAVSRALYVSDSVNLLSYPEPMRETISNLRLLGDARQRAFKNYYLGIRANHIRAAAALALWDQIEAIEIRRLEHEGQQLPKEDVLDLQAAYLEVSKFCTQSDLTSLTTKSRPPGSVSRVAFQTFFNSLRDGKLSVEQLNSAVVSRKKIQESEVPDPLDYELYSEIWL